MNAYSKTYIPNAIKTLRSGNFTSIRGCAAAFCVPHQTLQHRISGRLSRSHAHEHRQILSSAEEKTLIRWITQLTNTDFLISSALGVQMAEEVRRNRFPLSRDPPSCPRPIGKSWLDRFRVRHPEIQGVWARKIEGARHKAMNVETVKTWFEAVTELYLQHQYDPERVYYMDESGTYAGRLRGAKSLQTVYKGATRPSSTSLNSSKTTTRAGTPSISLSPALSK